MKWLSACLADNRFIAVAFVALVVLNGYLMAEGYYS